MAWRSHRVRHRRRRDNLGRTGLCRPDGNGREAGRMPMCSAVGEDDRLPVTCHGLSQRNSNGRHRATREAHRVSSHVRPIRAKLAVSHEPTQSRRCSLPAGQHPHPVRRARARQRTKRSPRAQRDDPSWTSRKENPAPAIGTGPSVVQGPLYRSWPLEHHRDRSGSLCRDVGGRRRGRRWIRQRAAVRH